MSQSHGDSAPPARLAPTLRDGLFGGLPLVVFGSLMLVCLLTGADLAISRSFYSDELPTWPGRQSLLFHWCYLHGCKPAVWVGVAGLLAAIPSFFLASWRPARRPGLFLALTLILGPGLLVNGLLKPNVARPRPFQTEAFGGAHGFADVGFAEEAGRHSFPSGHASMGFYFMTPALLLYRRHTRWAAAIFLGGLSYGALIGVARIAQGAHFASDVFGSALCVWTAALLVLAGRLVLEWLLRRHAPDASARLLAFPDATDTRAA